MGLRTRLRSPPKRVGGRRWRGGDREGAREAFISSRYLAGGHVARPSTASSLVLLAIKLPSLYLRPLLCEPRGDTLERLPLCSFLMCAGRAPRIIVGKVPAEGWTTERCCWVLLFFAVPHHLALRTTHAFHARCSMVLPHHSGYRQPVIHSGTASSPNVKGC